MTDPDVERYVADEVARISKTWGYGYFKYDGMWTAMACEQLYVNDGYLPDDLGCQIFDDPTKTNVECFRKGLQMVRDAAGEEVFILGCNVSQNMRTMGASYGLVNAMRIGPDNGANWSGICAGPVRGSARYFYNGRVWYNDPDPVYVRNSIPLAHARAITSWAAITGGVVVEERVFPDIVCGMRMRYTFTVDQMGWRRSSVTNGRKRHDEEGGCVCGNGNRYGFGGFRRGGETFRLVGSRSPASRRLLPA